MIKRIKDKGRKGQKLTPVSSFPSSHRFGRGDSTELDDLEVFPETEDSIEKRNRNFLRFGRDRNFLRFGRSDAEDFALPGGPLAFANAVQDEDMLEDFPLEEKRAGHRNYLRFGRGNRNFLR